MIIERMVGEIRTSESIQLVEWTNIWMPAWPPLVVLGPAARAQNEWAKTEYRIGVRTFVDTYQSPDHLRPSPGLDWVACRHGTSPSPSPQKSYRHAPKACLMCNLNPTPHPHDAASHARGGREGNPLRRTGIRFGVGTHVGPRNK